MYLAKVSLGYRWKSLGSRYRADVVDIVSHIARCRVDIVRYCPAMQPLRFLRDAKYLKRFSNVSDEDSSSSVGTLTHGSPERPNEMITCARSVPTCDALFRQRPKYVRTSNVSTQASEYSESARR